MKLNNKGFAISSIMYIILVMAILIITITLSVLSSRKLVLDKLRSEVSNKINQDIELSYKDTLKAIKVATQSYIDSGHSIDDTYVASVSIDNLKVNNYLNISDKVLNYYNLNDKYVGFKNNNSIYSFMIGKEVDYNDLKGDLLDIVNYHIEGQSVQNGTPTPDTPVEIESVGDLVTLDNCESYGGEACNNIGKYVIPVTVSGKNLLHYSYKGHSVTTAGVELSAENDVLTINGTATSTILLSFFNNLGIVEDITLSAGTYTISVQGTGTVTDNGTFLQVFKVDGDSLTSAGQIGLNKNLTFTLEKTQKIRLRVIVYSGRSYNATFNIQLEEGSSATEYEPYKGTITNIYLDEPLRKVGDYADYIDFKNKKIIRNVRKSVFDGTEDWSYDSNFKAFKLLDNKFMTEQKPMSNQFIGISSGILNNDNSLLINNDSIYVTRWSLKGDLSKYKESLKENNLKLINVLKSPVEQSMDFQNIVVRGGNKIEIDTSVKPSNTTYKVIEKMFDINV